MKLTKFKLSHLLLGLCALVLVSCDAVDAGTKIVKVLADPDIPVGEATQQPSNITINAYAAENSNSTFDGQPSPVVVKLLALGSDHRFYGYDFFSLTLDTEESLDVTLREFLDEVSVQPGQYVVAGPYQLPPRTKYIGAIAEFQDIDRTIWRATVKVSDIGDNSGVLMLLLADEVRLQKEE